MAYLNRGLSVYRSAQVGDRWVWLRVCSGKDSSNYVGIAIRTTFLYQKLIVLLTIILVSVEREAVTHSSQNYDKARFIRMKLYRRNSHGHVPGHVAQSLYFPSCFRPGRVWLDTNTSLASLSMSSVPWSLRPLGTNSRGSRTITE